MPISASIPGLAGVPFAKGRAKTDPYRIALSRDDEDTFVSWLIGEIQAAEQARAPIIQDHGAIDAWHEYYEQVPVDRSHVWPGAASLSSWLPAEKVDALRARLTQIVFGPSPICAVEGYGETQERCAKVEAFHEWKAKDEKLRTWVSRAIHMSLIEGTGVLECSERRLIRKFQAQAKVHAVTDEHGSLQLDDKGLATPMRGERGELDVCEDADCTRPSMTVHYDEQTAVCDGPQYRILSLKDFLFLPSHARDTSEVWGFAKRVYLRLPELQQRQDAGFYKNVDRLGTEGEREQRTEDSRQGRTIAPQQGPTAEKPLWEVHLYYDIDGDGLEEWIIATVSVTHGVCLRLEHDALRQVRYTAFTPYPRADGVYGYSFVGHKLASVAREHAALRNQIADRGALAVNAPIKRLRDGYWNPDDQPWGPLAVIEVARMDEIQQQVIQDVPQSTVFQKRDVEEAAERLSGLNDQSVIGAGSPTQITATQVQQEAHASFVRIDEPVHYLQESLAELYQLRNEIWRRTLLAHEQGVVPNTTVLHGLETIGLTVPTDGPFRFTADDLAGHFSFTPKGSVETADIYRQREDYTMFLSQALPALVQLDPNLAQQLQQNPKFGEALLQRALHLYRLPDLQNALATAGPPQAQTALGGLMGQPGAAGMPPAGPGALTPPPGGAGASPMVQALLAALQGGGGAPSPSTPMPGPMGPQ